MITFALNVGGAIGVLVQGKLIDRYGQTLILGPSGIACAGSLVLLLEAATHGMGILVMLALASIAGLSLPAIPGSMRVLWVGLIADQDGRSAAYALHAVQFAVALVLGPLVAAWTFVVGGAQTALLLTAILQGASTVLFVSSSASRRWEPSNAAFRLSGAGLATRGLWTLLLGASGMGFANGVVNIGVATVSHEKNSMELAGVLLAFWSIGEICGGMIYGSRLWGKPLNLQLSISQTGEAACWLCSIPILVLNWKVGAVVVVILVAGVARAPSVIISSALLDTVSKPERLTESYTALIAVTLFGIAAGSYAGGAIQRYGGEVAVFALAAGSLMAVAAWTSLRRRTL